MQENVINQKICLLGMFATGKTSLVRRYVHDIFDEKYLSTIGVNVTQKLLPPLQKDKSSWTQYNFVIWDIEGSDPQNKLVKNYYLGAHGAILVADLTRVDTLDGLDKLITAFKSVNPDARLILAGSKYDLCTGKANDAVNTVQQFGKERDMQVLITSSKTGENVNDLFINLANKL